MNCEQAESFLQLYADGELDAPRALEFEKHLDNCPGCAVAVRNLKTLKKATGQNALFFTAPRELRARVKTAVRSEAGGRAGSWNWNWLTTVITSAATAVVAVVLTLTRPVLRRSNHCRRKLPQVIFAP